MVANYYIAGPVGRGGGRSIIGGGGANIHIFLFTNLENNGFKKKTDKAEHEYINISTPPPPPTYRSSAATRAK